MRGFSQLFGFLLVLESFFRVQCFQEIHRSAAAFKSRIAINLASTADGVDDPRVTDVLDDATDNAATLRSISFCNLPKEEEPDLLCDFLMEIGACSTSIVDADAGTDREQALFDEKANDAWQDSLQWATPVWNRCNVTAHVPASTNVQSVLDLVATTFSGQFPSMNKVRIEQVPNKDWVVHVQQSWNPIVVANKFVLRFPWHTDAHVQTTLAGHDDRKDMIELQLQGGIAFGTGEHPTTQLCLEWLHCVVMQQLSDSKEDPVRVLDYGTGSGVLGMAACALARNRVTAIGTDIDVDAVRIANANAVDNLVDMRSYLPPLGEDDNDDESKSLLLKAHAHAQAELGRRGETSIDDLVLPTDLQHVHYDVCVANILAGPLVTLAPTISSMLRPGGVLGMSGILLQQADMILEAYQAADFKDLVVEKEQDGWILVTGTKKP